MPRRLAPLLIAIVAALAATAASAQPQLCERYRAELASLGQGSDDGRAGQYAAAARRQRAELERLNAYHAQIGCERGGGFIFFNRPAPPECGGIAQRMRQMEANLNQMLGQAQQYGGGPGVEMRRRQLIAAIDQTCGTGPNFLERLFGGPGERGRDRDVPVQEGEPLQGEGRGGVGGSRVVCVRTCDGYFFPLPTGGRDGAGELCQALCPAAEMEVFSMPPDGTVERAAGPGGKAYSELPNAARYKKQLVAGCSCRKPGESWSQALRHAEQLLERRKTDIFVTAQKAEELSRPKPVEPKKTATAKDAKVKTVRPAEADPEAEPPADQATVPTAGQESAGIGPQNIEGDKAVSQREGQTREVVGTDGQKQKVRVVSPNIFSTPQAPARGKPQ